MAQTESCNCAAVDDEKIDTWQKFEKAKEYFEAQVKQGIFEEEKVTKPYHTWRSDGLEGLLGLENDMQQNGTGAVCADAFGKLNTPIFRSPVLSENSKTENTFR